MRKGKLQEKKDQNRHLAEEEKEKLINLIKAMIEVIVLIHNISWKGKIVVKIENVIFFAMFPNQL